MFFFPFKTRIWAQCPYGKVVLSAPAENESGTGSSTATPTNLTEPCEFDTCPTGSPAEGFNSSDCMWHATTPYNDLIRST